MIDVMLNYNDSIITLSKVYSLASENNKIFVASENPYAKMIKIQSDNVSDWKEIKVTELPHSIYDYGNLIFDFPDKLIIM